MARATGSCGCHWLEPGRCKNNDSVCGKYCCNCKNLGGVKDNCKCDFKCGADDGSCCYKKCCCTPDQPCDMEAPAPVPALLQAEVKGAPNTMARATGSCGCHWLEPGRCKNNDSVCGKYCCNCKNLGGVKDNCKCDFKCGADDGSCCYKKCCCTPEQPCDMEASASPPALLQAEVKSPPNTRALITGSCGCHWLEPGQCKNNDLGCGKFCCNCKNLGGVVDDCKCTSSVA